MTEMVERFVGKRVRRRDDAALLTGQGTEVAMTAHLAHDLPEAWTRC